MEKAGLLRAVVYLFVTSIVSADTLIYSNSILSGYHYYPGAYIEILDYGTTPGGLVSKFSFDYIEGNTTAGTILVRFYEDIKPNLYDPGNQIKLYALTFVPGTNGRTARYEYVIPHDERFILPSGNFGYSFEYSQSSTSLVLASGGAGQVNELWEYYDHGLYGESFNPFKFYGNVWAGLSMKIYTIPEPASALMMLLGAAWMAGKRRR